MRILRITASIAISVLALFTPAIVAAQQHLLVAQAAQPTPEQVKAAVKNALMSVNLTLRQKREIKSMVDNYKTETANVDEATKQADAKSLLKNIYDVLTPDQQTQFKASIKQSLAMDVQ
jgi:t-SNARE complex subunit (syntaxin)